MTKGELRKARIQARADGLPLTGELAIRPTYSLQLQNERIAPRKRRISRSSSKAEQHARYIDCGPANWDDR